MNCVINCSSDRLQIWLGVDYYELPNRGLEIDRPGQFIAWMKQYIVTDIRVINGPGSFTTLRVVCLTVNLYVSTHPNQIKLHHCTKTGLYDRVLPILGLEHIAIYIGQRNNVRLYDLTTKSYDIVTKSDIKDSVVYDDVSDNFITDHDRIYLGFQPDSSQMTVKYKENTASIALSEIMIGVEILHPHYLMEPNISHNQKS